MASKRGYGTITSSGTAVIRASAAKLEKIVAVNPGTTWIYSVYDSSSAVTAAALIQTRTLSSNDNLEFNIPCQNGITVVFSGTVPGTALVVWST